MKSFINSESQIFSQMKRFILHDFTLKVEGFTTITDSHETCVHKQCGKGFDEVSAFSFYSTFIVLMLYE